MELEGTVQNGVVVPADPSALTEGAKVKIVVEAPARAPTLAERLLKHAGTVPDLPADGIQLYSQRPDKEWSLTDCVSFVAMQRREITDALTKDHHFEQAGFVALLK